MRTVGVRELKEHTSEILRRVREDGEMTDCQWLSQFADPAECLLSHPIRLIIHCPSREWGCAS